MNVLSVRTICLKYSVYKYVYGDGEVEYVRVVVAQRIPVTKTYRAVFIKNMTSGIVIKDRYGKTPRRESTETEQFDILDNDLFEI